VSEVVLGPDSFTISTMADLLAELQKIPPMTRLAMASAVIITAPLMMRLMSPLSYSFNWGLITNKLQVRIPSSILRFLFAHGAIRPLDIPPVYLFVDTME
jgi:hypothetical protein